MQEEAGPHGIETEVRGQTTVVRPYGELVVDLQHLTFCDSAGLHTLLHVRNTCANTSASSHPAASSFDSWS